MSKMSKVVFASILFVMICCFSNVGFAQVEYHASWNKDGAIFGASALFSLAGVVIEDQRPQFDLTSLASLNPNDVNSFDRSAIGNFSDGASKSSDYFKDGAIIAPLLLFLSEDIRKQGKTYFLMYCEVGIANVSLTNFSKAVFGRYRPYVYNPDVPDAEKLKATSRRSFYSGHVSHVSSLSFFTATVFSDMYPDSKYKPLVWAGALTAPALTGYLRYKAGRHFASDVIVGYGMGALVGYLIPRWHKSLEKHNVSIANSGSQLGVSLVF